MDKCRIFVKLLTVLLVVKNCSGIYMFDAKLEKMIELNARKPHCRVHTDRGHVSRKITETCFFVSHTTCFVRTRRSKISFWTLTSWKYEWFQLKPSIWWKTYVPSKTSWSAIRFKVICPCVIKIEFPSSLRFIVSFPFWYVFLYDSGGLSFVSANLFYL